MTKLDDAIAVFRELGWVGVTPEEAEHLTLGTPDQRRVALAGLSSGQWGEVREISENRYGWVSDIAVDEKMLALFAVRVGVDARRAASIMPSVGDELASRILAQRGPDFAARFIEHACRSNRRMWEHVTSTHAGAAVRLVAELGIPVPENVEYLKDWAVFASGALTGEGDIFPSGRGWIEDAALRSRYREHARVAVAVGVPATGPFSYTFVPAVQAGWMDRDEALDLAFRGLDAAQRPGDRKAWLRVVLHGLTVTDDELRARTDALIALMSFGDSYVIEGVGPALIALVDDDQLGDVVTAGLTVNTIKAQRLLLAALAQRPRPNGDTVVVVAEVVAELLDAKSPAVQRDAHDLLVAWGVHTSQPSEAAIELRGRWCETPVLWEVPRLDLSPATPTALTESAASLTTRPEGVVDIEVERFLHLANEVARADVAAAKDALRGVRPGWIGGLRSVPSWLAGEPGPLADGGEHTPGTAWAPVEAREEAVFRRLGEVPSLLSTPTWIDLRIDPAVLVARLQEYERYHVEASEADLLLALTRVDPTLVTDGLRDAAAAVRVPVVTQDGERLTVGAGEAVVRYLAEPVTEPQLRFDIRWRRWSPATVETPASLAPFPGRFGVGPLDTAVSTVVFPHWGDAAFFLATLTSEAHTGLLLRQAVRRSQPLGPAGAINLLAAQRGFHPSAAEDGMSAIVEAWQRGILRPGVADIGFLDWSEDLGQLAALADACLRVADEGLLSVVWPVLDSILVRSAAAPRLLSGTTEIVDVVAALLPAVRTAVAEGRAPTSALDLPGLRATAARAGSSRAVTAAKAVTLPEATSPPPPPAEPAAVDFDAQWPASAGSAPALIDDATLTVGWIDDTKLVNAWERPGTPPRFIAVDLVLADAPDTIFRIAKSWFFDVQNEGQCSAKRISADGTETDAWIRWDPAASRLVAGTHRDWVHGTPHPLPRGTDVPPLTSSIIAAVIASLCNDSADLIYTGGLMNVRGVGSASVTIAMRRLLEFPDVNPARIVRLIEKVPLTLPTMWPVLVESVRHAADVEGGAPPWLNRVLTAAISQAPILREAALRGLVPATWPGLEQLRSRPKLTTTVRRKLDQLSDALT